MQIGLLRKKWGVHISGVSSGYCKGIITPYAAHLVEEYLAPDLLQLLGSSDETTATPRLLAANSGDTIPVRPLEKCFSLNWGRPQYTTGALTITYTILGGSLL